MDVVIFVFLKVNFMFRIKMFECGLKSIIMVSFRSAATLLMLIYGLYVMQYVRGVREAHLNNLTPQ